MSNPNLCPTSVKAAFIAYRDDGVPPGDFVRACLENNLCEAFKRADNDNRIDLEHIVAWLYWNMPSTLWGSPAAVNRHLAAMVDDAAPERDETVMYANDSLPWSGGYHDIHKRPGDEHNPEGGL